MDKVKMETRKFFDVQWGIPKMPEHIRKYYFNQYDKCNDVWVEYTVGMSAEHMTEYEEGYDILDLWLMDNFDIEDGEVIFLSYWW